MTATEEKAHRLRPYPNYKDSGVEWIGEIPAHWLAQPIRRVFSVSGGTTPDSNTPAFWDGDVLWATPEDISKVRGKYLTDTRRKITQEGAAKTGLTLLPEGTLLLTTRAPIGNLCLTAAPMTFNQGCKALKAPSHILPEHFFHVLNAAVPALQAAGKGTTFLELSASNLKSFILPVPTLEEQQAIAAYLDRETARIDELMREQEALLDDLNAKKEAILNRTISLGFNRHSETKPTGNDFIPFIPAGWSIKRLKQISPQQTVGVVVNPTSYVENDGTVPFLLGSNVKEMGFKTDGVVYISEESNKELQKTRLRSGDIVTVRVGAPGVTAVISEELDGCNCASVMIIRQHPSFDSTWLAYAMNSRVGRAQVEVVQYGAAQKQFNISHAVDFFFPVPPLEEQQAIAAYLDEQLAQIDELREEVRANIEDMRIHRSALITAAVTGKIDVREAE